MKYTNQDKKTVLFSLFFIFWNYFLYFYFFCPFFSIIYSLPPNYSLFFVPFFLYSIKLSLTSLLQHVKIRRYMAWLPTKPLQEIKRSGSKQLKATLVVFVHFSLSCINPRFLKPTKKKVNRSKITFFFKIDEIREVSLYLEALLEGRVSPYWAACMFNALDV